MKTKELADKILASAKQHAEDSGEPDMEVGDLQEVVRVLAGSLAAKDYAALIADLRLYLGDNVGWEWLNEEYAKLPPKRGWRGAYGG